MARTPLQVTGHFFDSGDLTSSPSDMPKQSWLPTRKGKMREELSYIARPIGLRGCKFPLFRDASDRIFLYASMLRAGANLRTGAFDPHRIASAVLKDILAPDKH